jgi:ribosomal protein S18 acetylase RimI-like enzyme
MQVKIFSAQDDLASLANAINTAQWDDANEMTDYSAEDLAHYLQQQDTVFVACYDAPDSSSGLLGIASARIQIKPYDKERWLYVDEVDVCVNQRRRGAGKAIMQALLAIARDNGCQELWLGTEIDNLPANALYKSLGADEIEEFVGYSYRLGDE